LVEARHGELADRPFGARRALGPGLRGPHVREPVDLGVDPQPRERVASDRVVPLRVLLPLRDRGTDHPRPPGRHLAPDRDALVHQRRERDVPALADIAEAFAVGDPDAGHVDLVELGFAGRLYEGAHLDTVGVHVDDGHRQALVLDLLRICAYQHDSEARDVGQRGPDLLAVDDPLVAVAHAAHRQAGDVGARAGLAEELAPNLFAREQRAQVTRLLLRAAVRDDGRRT